MQSPKGNDLSSSCLVTTFKQTPDQHIKSKQSISDVSFNAFASSLVKGQKKKVNFDLPSIKQPKPTAKQSELLDEFGNGNTQKAICTSFTSQ